MVLSLRGLGCLVAVTLAAVACSSTPAGPPGETGGTGGQAATGGAAGRPSAETGGAAGSTGGAATGGSAGKAMGPGGRATGGASTGGAGAPGGRGGSALRGGSGGPTGTGGASSVGGRGTGGATSGGATGNGPSFLIGADITNAQSAPAAAQDSLFRQLKEHGFNAIRARIFVDPTAADGYDKRNGTADLAHTVAWGKRVKDEGMSFLLDFHYSDNWADPGKQCVPVAWQSLGTIAELSAAVHDYTKDAIAALVAGGARPDMVQVGNEITPGMLIHRCDSGGQPMGNNPVTGSTSNWSNLGMLLKAGVQGIKDVDPSILIMLHIDRCHQFNTSKSWIDNAMKQGVAFDVFGESCYQRYQGDPDSVPNTVAGWKSTFMQLLSAYPQLRFVAAEYGPAQREINDVLFNLPNQRGLGTYNWEPDTQGDWNTGHVLLVRSGNAYTAQPDLQLYDAMKTAYASRL